MSSAQIHDSGRWTRRRSGRPTSSPSHRAQAGFTLIELMAVVVVISILALIALPSYMESVRKSRRADAVTLLNQVAQAQERWRANNVAYSVDASASGINVANPSSGYYTLQIASASATGYTATATTAGAQTADARCTTLRLALAGGNITYSHTGSAATWQTCWNR